MKRGRGERETERKKVQRRRSLQRVISGGGDREENQGGGLFIFYRLDVRLNAGATCVSGLVKKS